MDFDFMHSLYTVQLKDKENTALNPKSPTSKMWCQFSCSPNFNCTFKFFSLRAKAGRWNLWQWKPSAQIFSRSLATQHKYHGGSFVKRAGGTTKRWNMRHSEGKEEIGAPSSPPLDTIKPLCQPFEDHGICQMFYTSKSSKFINLTRENA